MKRRLKFRILPSWQNALLALLAAGLLVVAFPDFEWWWTAWFALVPLMWAVEREKAAFPSFMLGWLFGTTFFFGTCWWLTYAPIHYAGVPAWLAYLLIFTACLLTGLFPGLFAAILARLLQRFGSWAFLAAPFVWVFTEFARYWLTGNNWNAVGYSQAFSGCGLLAASWGSIWAVGVLVIFPQSAAVGYFTGYLATLEGYGTRYWEMAGEIGLTAERIVRRVGFEGRTQFDTDKRVLAVTGLLVLVGVGVIMTFVSSIRTPTSGSNLVNPTISRALGIQGNVPASGLDQFKWQDLRDKQFAAAQTATAKLPTVEPQLPTLIVLPESPMNFAYNDDREFQQYVRDFTTRNNVSLLFNSAEPDKETGKYFNSAVMVGPDGRKVAEYDKIYLLPFGEAVPFPFEGLMPAVVGSFAYGKNYSLVPVGDAKAGVMICFESHFGSLSREYVKQGADVIIEMTNDGYLGPTPVLRQHLANAVFRAVETNRPVLRVTNVGITAYITGTGQVIDPAPTYTQATRVWSVSKSDGSQTFYVKYGDWFAWLCTITTLVMLLTSLGKRRLVPNQ